MEASLSSPSSSSLPASSSSSSRKSHHENDKTDKIALLIGIACLAMLSVLSLSSQLKAFLPSETTDALTVSKAINSKPLSASTQNAKMNSAAAPLDLLEEIIDDATTTITTTETTMTTAPTPSPEESSTIQSPTSGKTKTTATSIAPRISFSVHPGQQTTVTHVKYQCRLEAGNKRNRTYASPTIINLNHHVTVRTQITTNLKIAMIGDSLGYQFFHALEDAMTEPNSNVTEHIPLYYTYRKIHEGLTLVSPVRGSGTLAFWRMTGMWIDEHMYKPLPYQGRGWLPRHATLLLNTTLSDNVTKPLLIGGNDDNNNNNSTMMTDAMVFRIPHGWIRGSHVTMDSLNQTVQHAREYLNVKCVILVSMFFNNNIQSFVDWNDLQEGNERVRQFAKQENKNNKNTTSDFPILVLDMDRLMHSIIEANAIDLGMMTTTTTNYSSWINASIQERLPAKHPPSVAHVCGKLPAAADEECDYNFVSLDGMHICMETLGGRINAGIACLLGCVFNNKEDDDGGEGAVDLPECESACNAKYMNPNIALYANNRTTFRLM